MSANVPPAARPVITGLGVLSACGPGPGPLAEAVTHGRTGFTEVRRFDATARRTRRAALLPDPLPLGDAVAGVIADACRQAALDEIPGEKDVAAPHGTTAPDGIPMPLLLALHSDLRTGETAARVARTVAGRWGVPGVTRVYTGACVAAGSAVADAAALIASGRHTRVLVAAGHLVEPGVFAAFDAGRALARDGELRPFSAGRSGTLLGDAAVAVVVEAEPAAERRGAPVLARLAGWGRSGDAYHVCRPVPDGEGLARAVGSALARAGVDPAEVGYVNANGTGSPLADRAEAWRCAGCSAATWTTSRSAPASPCTDTPWRRPPCSNSPSRWGRCATACCR